MNKVKSKANQLKRGWGAVTGKPAAQGAGINGRVTWKGIMEWWNLGILEADTPREGRRIDVQSVDPTALPKRERRRPLRQSHSVRPSQSRYSSFPIIPTFPYSNIPV